MFWTTSIYSDTKDLHFIGNLTAINYNISTQLQTVSFGYKPYNLK